METSKTKIAQGGRVVIPAQYRRALGLKVGDSVVVSLEDNEIRIFSRRQAITQAQELMRPYVDKSRSLADELVAERRAEAARE